MRHSDLKIKYLPLVSEWQMVNRNLLLNYAYHYIKLGTNIIKQTRCNDFNFLSDNRNIGKQVSREMWTWNNNQVFASWAESLPVTFWVFCVNMCTNIGWFRNEGGIWEIIAHKITIFLFYIADSIGCTWKY